MERTEFSLILRELAAMEPLFMAEGNDDEDKSETSGSETSSLSSSSSSSGSEKGKKKRTKVSKKSSGSTFAQTSMAATPVESQRSFLKGQKRTARAKSTMVKPTNNAVEGAGGGIELALSASSSPTLTRQAQAHLSSANNVYNNADVTHPLGIEMNHGLLPVDTKKGVALTAIMSSTTTTVCTPPVQAAGNETKNVRRTASNVPPSPLASASPKRTVGSSVLK